MTIRSQSVSWPNARVPRRSRASHAALLANPTRKRAPPISRRGPLTCCSTLTLREAPESTAHRAQHGTSGRPNHGIHAEASQQDGDRTVPGWVSTSNSTATSDRPAASGRRGRRCARRSASRTSSPGAKPSSGIVASRFSATTSTRRGSRTTSSSTRRGRTTPTSSTRTSCRASLACGSAGSCPARFVSG